MTAMPNKLHFASIGGGAVTYTSIGGETVVKVEHPAETVDVSYPPREASPTDPELPDTQSDREGSQ